MVGQTPRKLRTAARQPQPTPPRLAPPQAAPVVQAPPPPKLSGRKARTARRGAVAENMADVSTGNPIIDK